MATYKEEDYTISTDGPTCPYCGFAFTPDDNCYYEYSYDEDECPECNKKFRVEVEIETTWTTFVCVPG